MKKSGYPWRFSLFMMAYYGTNAVFQGYISKFYQQAGMDGQRLVLLMTVTPLTAMFAQPMWGMLGDRAKSRNRVLRVMALIALAAAVCLYIAAPSFGWLLASAALFAAAFTSLQPMGDSVILESLQKTRDKFGPIRLLACYAFATINLIAGPLLTDRFSYVPLITACLLLTIFAATYALPETPGHQQRGKEKVPLRRVFAVPGLTALLLFTMVLQLALGYFYSYYTLFFTQLPGGTPALLGLAYFLSATSETPFLLFFDRLYDKFGTGRLMLFSALTLVVRFAILGFCENAYVALASQLLHGGGFIVITVCMAKFISLHVPDELKASGQMVLAIAGFGISRVFGILGGGLIAGALGSIAWGFVCMAGLCLVALIVFAPRYIRAKE